MFKLHVSCIAVLLAVSHVSAGVIIGPGDISVTTSDGASFDLLAVDLNSPANLGAGSYVAALFNYQFSIMPPGSQPLGVITPVLLTGAGTSFTPVAVGDPVSYTGPTAFVSAPFGGTDTFALGIGTTLYGGLFWHATLPPGGPDTWNTRRMPIGYAGGVSTFVRYQSANPPVVGNPISGGSAEFFGRSYDFSIEVTPVSAVPVPPTLLLALTGGSLLHAWGIRRRGNRRTPVLSLRQ